MHAVVVLKLGLTEGTCRRTTNPANHHTPGRVLSGTAGCAQHAVCFSRLVRASSFHADACVLLLHEQSRATDRLITVVADLQAHSSAWFCVLCSGCRRQKSLVLRTRFTPCRRSQKSQLPAASRVKQTLEPRHVRTVTVAECYCSQTSRKRSNEEKRWDWEMTDSHRDLFLFERMGE